MLGVDRAAVWPIGRQDRAAREGGRRSPCEGGDRFSPEKQSAVGAFTTAIAEATAEVAGGYKPNCAFFEALGRDGDHALAATVDAIWRLAPDAAVVLDAKRADVRSTNDGYLQSILGLGVDCVTVHPYLGGAALASFLAQEDLVVFVSARDLEPGSRRVPRPPDRRPAAYRHVARAVATRWDRGRSRRRDAFRVGDCGEGPAVQTGVLAGAQATGRTLTSGPAFAAGVPDLHAHGSRSPRPLIVRRDCGGCDRRGRSASPGAASASPGGRSRRGPVAALPVARRQAATRGVDRAVWR